MKLSLTRVVLLTSVTLLAGCIGRDKPQRTGPQAIRTVDEGLRNERPAIDAERVKAFGFQVHWEMPIRNEIITSINLEGDQLYAFTTAQRLYQVDLHSGMVNWVYNVGRDLSFTDQDPISEWLYEQDKDTKFKEYDEIFFIAEDHLIGLDKKNGSELFTVPLRFTASSPPRATSSHVMVGSWDDRIYGIRKDAPTVPDWFWRTNDDVRTRAGYYKPTTFVCSRDGTMYTFDAATGRRKWSFRTDKQITQSPLIYKSLLYLPSDDYNLYVVDVADGLLHHRTCVESPLTTPPVGIDKTIYFGAQTGMHALLRKSKPEGSRKIEHELLWTRKKADKVLCKGSEDIYVREPGEAEGDVVIARLDAKDGHFRDSLGIGGVDYWVTNPLSPADLDQKRSLRGGIIILGFRNGWVVALKELATIPGA